VPAGQSSGVLYLRASQLLEHIKKPSPVCTSSQKVKLLNSHCLTGMLPRRVLQPGLCSALAQASLHITALHEGLVHVFIVFTHATTLGGCVGILGDRMAAQIDLGRLKSLGAMGCRSLRTSTHFCTWAGSAETTNTGWGRQHF